MEIFLVILLIIVIVALLYLLLLMPGRADRAKVMKSTLYAHRGYHNISLGIPENSIAAFRRAKAFGYGVELDIQLTKDRKIVVFHDETLKRMCGIERNVRDCTYEQLQKYSLLKTGEHIPLFEDVLEMLGSDTPVLCELKIYGGYKNLEICEAALPIIQRYQKNMVIESFNPLAVLWFKKNAPEIVRGQLSCNFSKSNDDVNPILGFLLGNLLFNVISLPDFIAYRNSDSDCISLKIAKKLYAPYLVAWTIKSDKEHRSALRNGFQTVIFENYQATPLRNQLHLQQRQRTAADAPKE